MRASRRAAHPTRRPANPTRRASRRAPPSQILNPRVLESSFQTQHVPTAKQLFSVAAVEKMQELGHDEAAEWAKVIALYYASFDQRGFCTAVRRAMADEVRRARGSEA